MEESKKVESTVEGFTNAEQQSEEESSFNLRTIYSIVILNWPWFLLSLFIFVCGAMIYQPDAVEHAGHGLHLELYGY